MTLQKSSHTFREAAQLVGIGLQASGSYVCGKFNADAYKALTQQALSELRFSKEKSVAVVTSDKEAGKGGTVARIVRVSECGQFVKYADDSVLSTEIVSMRVLSLADFVNEAIRANVCATIARVENKAVVEGSRIRGFVFGSLGESYSSLVYTLNGKVQIKDIETKANAYNSHELVAITDQAEAMAMAETLASKLRKAAGVGEVEAVAKAKKKTTAKKGKAKATATEANADSAVS